MECISNPAKSRLMIEIMRRGKVTAKYLAEKCVDIPQTTLYRYLKRMTDDGLLKIVGETPIRGTVEKTYALTFDPSDPPSVLGQNSGAMYMQMFFQYFLTFAKIFQDYCDTPGIDIKKDRSGLSSWRTGFSLAPIQRGAKFPPSQNTLPPIRSIPPPR